MTAPVVYGADRERRLRLVLRVVLVPGVGLVLLGLWAIVGVGGDSRRLGVFLAVLGVLLLGVTWVALRALTARDRTAKYAAIATGVLVVGSGLLLARTIVGFAMIVLGIAILFLALLRDDPDLF